ncbi:MAG: NAD(P)/FAD-dependent oxidoreductase [Hyphomicrobiaceae bacterium]
MSRQTFDVVVIGAGPAGLEAAAIAASAGLKVVAIDKMGPGGQLMNLGPLIGVPNLEADATGPDLLAEIVDRAMSAGAEIAIDDVSNVRRDADGEHFVVEALEATYGAPAVVIATGLTPGTTGLANESHYEGIGLSHCAHCDAPLFEGQPVAVAGSDAWAVEEAIELAAHASVVALITEGRPAASEERLSILRGLGNVTEVEGRISALTGRDALEGIDVAGAGGAVSRISARGLFLQTGRRPARGLVTDHLIETGGVFLAGDVRDGSARTIPEAIAEGVRAGHNAVEWVRARRRA